MDERCPLCGGRLLRDEETGELVCESCGYVVSTIPNRGPEWRPYSLRESSRRARAGAPATYLLHDLGLSTHAPPDKSLKPTARERKLISILSEIHGLSARLRLPEKVAETAALLYRRAESRRLRSRFLKAEAAAYLYTASKLFNLPRSLKEFAEASGVEEKAIAARYRRISGVFNLHPQPSATAYVSRIVRQIGLSGSVESAAHRLLEEADRLGLTQGRKPAVLAAASVYVAASLLREKVSQRALSKIVYISPGTLRKRYKELLQKINVEEIFGAALCSRS